MRTGDRRTVMTKLTEAFRDYANACVNFSYQVHITYTAYIKVARHNLQCSHFYHVRRC